MPVRWRGEGRARAIPPSPRVGRATVGAAAMRVGKLKLRQFRGFEQFDLDLDTHLTVLVGENASGKTSVLEGMAVAVGGLLAAMRVPGPRRHIREEDVRYVTIDVGGLPQLTFPGATSVTADGEVSGIGVTWERKRETGGGRTSQRTAEQLAKIGASLSQRVLEGQAVDLPVLAYYGTQRVWLQKKATEAKRGVGQRYDGYTDALEPASNHRLLSEWMYQQTLAELQSGTRLPHVEAIEAAVRNVIEGATAFRFDIKRAELEVHFGSAVVPFHYLSDGYRNMVALAADLAWRAAVLNPHYGKDAPSMSPGLVLIDEVELHLHPKWQRRVLLDLRAAFPYVQFVVTTHSPQVVASAQRGQVMVLKPDGATAVPFVEGRDTNSLLEDVFGEPYRPAPTQQELNKLARLVHEEDYAAAETTLAELEQRLGPTDPALQRARFELRLERSEGGE